VYSLKIELESAQRARWLAELSSALNEAQRLLSRFSLEDGDQRAFDLNLRISAAQAEIRSLQSQSLSRQKPSDREWSGSPLWD
jgi:hypothetical protein